MTQIIFLVSLVDVETHIILYACKTREKALEKFNEVRLDCIRDVEDMIISFPDNEWIAKKKFLERMKPNELPPMHLERPIIEMIELLE